MPKRPKNDTLFFQKSLSFIDFWLFIARQVGACRLDLNPNAKNLDELFTKNAVHPQHLKQVITNSLPHKTKNSQLPALKGFIDLCQLLDALGETAFELRQSSADDLLDIELLEEIAWYISERFSHHISGPSATGNKTEQDHDQDSAELVYFANFKSKAR